jgi:hypothetical protein
MAVFRACAKVLGPDDPTMRIYERGPWSGPLTGTLAATLPAGPGSDGEVPAAVAFGPGGTTLAAGGINGITYPWTPLQGRSPPPSPTPTAEA